MGNGRTQPDKDFIIGVDFSAKTKILRLNYRNPAPIYAISLALLLRLNAEHGRKAWYVHYSPKIHFGIDLQRKEKTNSFVLQFDAHSGNNWSHCVDILTSCESALTMLRPFRFHPQDVLWVRFGKRG